MKPFIIVYLFTGGCECCVEEFDKLEEAQRQYEIEKGRPEYMNVILAEVKAAASGNTGADPGIVSAA
jgi:hypothetical protein